MSKQPESLLKERAQRELKKLPKTWFFKVQLVALCGIPDIIGVCNGRFFAWELKAVGGKPTKLQVYVLEKIRAAGGITRIVYPQSLGPALEELKLQINTL